MCVVILWPPPLVPFAWHAPLLSMAVPALVGFPKAVAAALGTGRVVALCAVQESGKIRLHAQHLKDYFSYFCTEKYGPEEARLAARDARTVWRGVTRAGGVGLDRAWVLLCVWCCVRVLKASHWRECLRAQLQ